MPETITMFLTLAPRRIGGNPAGRCTRITVALFRGRSVFPSLSCKTGCKTARAAKRGRTLFRENGCRQVGHVARKIVLTSLAFCAFCVLRAPA